MSTYAKINKLNLTRKAGVFLITTCVYILRSMLRSAKSRVFKLQRWKVQYLLRMKDIIFATKYCFEFHVTTTFINAKLRKDK